MTTDLAALINKPQFPKAATYDPDWVFDNQMGPNALWLVEWLMDTFPLEPGMRVLDLGCGKALTSIFLAKEYDVQVTAADLWIAPHHNFRRAQEAGVGDRVCPVHAEAHALPFAYGFFDAAISIDAYLYFGADLLYLNYLANFLKPGAPIGVVVPALMRPFENGDVPEHLTTPQENGKVFWEDECRTFQTAQWWLDLWKPCNKVTGVEAEAMPDGWRLWAEWERALEKSGKGIFKTDGEAIERDGGRYLGFARVTARRSEANTVNLYDGSMCARMGVDV